MPNVVLTPHIASSTRQTRDAMKALAVEGLVSAMSGIPPKHFVNKEVWPRYLERMEKIILPEEDSSEAQPQLTMPWS
jgi:hypothetical protein